MRRYLKKLPALWAPKQQVVRIHRMTQTTLTDVRVTVEVGETFEGWDLSLAVVRDPIAFARYVNSIHPSFGPRTRVSPWPKNWTAWVDKELARTMSPALQERLEAERLPPADPPGRYVERYHPRP